MPLRDESGAIVLDKELLDQRAAFLRPDSVVAAIMISDENDCSFTTGRLGTDRVDQGARSTRAVEYVDPSCFHMGRPPSTRVARRGSRRR